MKFPKLKGLIAPRPLIAIALATVTIVAGAAAFGGMELERSEKSRMRRETLLALDHLQSYHFSKKSLDELKADDVIVNYLEELDYNHLFMLQSDVDELNLRFGETLFPAYLMQGDLFPAFEAFDIYRKRALERLEWVSDHLSDDFDFAVDEAYRPDRSEIDWPENQDEADDLWRKRIKYDIINEMLADQPIELAREKIERRYNRTRRYLEEIDATNVQEIFITSVAKMYDPHSTFFSADSMEEFSIAMHNALVGIGAILRDEDGYCVIQEVMGGGPAEMSGELHPGDKIVEVAQGPDQPVDVVDMKLRKIVKMIRGTKGSEVRLTIIPANASDASERKIISLVRDEIQLTENLARAEIFHVPGAGGKNIPVGVIELPSFYGPGVGDNANSSTTNDVEELIRKLKAAGVEGLVLDLRNNGGGLLNEAVSLAGLFIPKGPVVQVKDHIGRVREDWDRDPKVVYEGPLVVLVSRHSASASEIVAGALQNHNRALIVGDTSTHGKGTVQAIYPLDRNLVTSLFGPKNEKYGAAKITIQKFYLPSGASTQKEGVQADIVIPSVNEFLPIGEDDLDNALMWDTIEPLRYKPGNTTCPDWARISDPLLNALREASAERQTGHPEFAYLNSNIDWFRQKQEQKEISLNLEKRRQQRNEDKQYRENADLEREKLARKQFEREDVLLDISESMNAEHQAKLRSSLLPDGSSKANRYYQKVFYYQPADSKDIQEVWIEHFDYEKILKQSDELADYFESKAGHPLDPEALTATIEAFKNGEYSQDYLADKVFEQHFGDALTQEEINAFLPTFFTKLIEIDPLVLEENRPLDIPLREGLRIISDWLDVRDATPSAITADKSGTNSGA